MDAPTTKKFVGALSAKGHARMQAPFLIPALNGTLTFIDIRSGQPHDAGYVLYLGSAITTDDVLQQVEVSIADAEQARMLINSFIVELQQFKIGNVVSMEQSESNKVRLRLISNTPKSKPGPKLP